MSTIGEQTAKDERQKDRQSRIAQREAIERHLRRESWAIAGATVGAGVAVLAAGFAMITKHLENATNRLLVYIADAEETERRIRAAERLLAEWAPDPESFAASGSHDASTLMRGKIMGAKSVLRILRGES